MKESITHLLELVDQFPQRVRIDYDENADRMFCNNVLTALVKAAPDIRELSSTPLAPAVFDGQPSTTIGPGPEQANSSHSQDSTQDTGRPVPTAAEVADSVSAWDQTPGNDGTPASVDATASGPQTDTPEQAPSTEKLATTKAERRAKERARFSTHPVVKP